MNGFTLELATDLDLDRLQFLSAQARGRYASVPSLTFIADSPPVSAERFKACRVMLARNADDASIAGYAATRPLDGMLYLDNISVETARSGFGIGRSLMLDLLSYAHSITVSAITLTTFREPVWNGPWFRKYGFQPMPANRIGAGLRQVMERQSATLDPATRETLWREL